MYCHFSSELLIYCLSPGNHAIRATAIVRLGLLVSWVSCHALGCFFKSSSSGIPRGVDPYINDQSTNQPKKLLFQFLDEFMAYSLSSKLNGTSLGGSGLEACPIV